MKVLAVNSSPHKDKGNTALILRLFRATGHPIAVEEKDFLRFWPS